MVDAARTCGFGTEPASPTSSALGAASIEEVPISLEEAFIDYQRTALTAFQEVETRLDNEVVLRKREEALRAAQENLVAAYDHLEIAAEADQPPESLPRRL